MGLWCPTWFLRLKLSGSSVEKCGNFSEIYSCTDCSKGQLKKKKKKKGGGAGGIAAYDMTIF